MVRAKRIAPHVHSFIEIDFTQIDRVRAANKEKWAQAGVKVSYTGFVAWAMARVLPEFPMVNATVSGDNLHLPRRHQHRHRGGPEPRPHRAGDP
jgi:pyruvate dehydrogenase E2 component (dihydrolipoamide acetyltransferase)